jgi:hypothetical protein
MYLYQYLRTTHDDCVLSRKIRLWPVNMRLSDAKEPLPTKISSGSFFHHRCSTDYPKLLICIFFVIVTIRLLIYYN